MPRRSKCPSDPSDPSDMSDKSDKSERKSVEDALAADAPTQACRGGLLGGEDKAEAKAAAAKVGDVVVTARRATVPSAAAPATATIHA